MISQQMSGITVFLKVYTILWCPRNSLRCPNPFDRSSLSLNSHASILSAFVLATIELHLVHLANGFLLPLCLSVPENYHPVPPRARAPQQILTSPHFHRSLPLSALTSIGTPLSVLSEPRAHFLASCFFLGGNAKRVST